MMLAQCGCDRTRPSGGKSIAPSRGQNGEQRNREIVALSMAGHSKNAIARALGISNPGVTQTTESWHRGPVSPQEGGG
jgi:hypothetical protein